MINVVPKFLPVILHAWFFWRKQRQAPNDGYYPGSEQGIYFRTPGYREGKDGLEFTKGYFGLHWD